MQHTGGDMPKAKWKRQQLIILARACPEENVLTACKYHLKLGGPEAAYGECSKILSPLDEHCVQGCRFVVHS